MPPYANVLISNVPGPNITLYFAGAKQISTYPVSIPYHGMGLNITLQSYNGWLDFGLISCQKLMPDISELATHMKKAHQKLLDLSLKATQQLEAKPDASIKPEVLKKETKKPEPVPK